MANVDGSVQVVFDGEIYNHPALRRKLEAEGCRFVTAHSDTGVSFTASSNGRAACGTTWRATGSALSRSTSRRCRRRSRYCLRGEGDPRQLACCRQSIFEGVDALRIVRQAKVESTCLLSFQFLRCASSADERT
jgi:hypothetical protein